MSSVQHQEARIQRKLAHLRGRDLRADTELWVLRCCRRSADRAVFQRELQGVMRAKLLPMIIRDLTTTPLLSRLLGKP